MTERIARLLESCSSGKPLMPRTELYKEGWLLRLTLDWFGRHADNSHPLAVPKDARWYSEALLSTRFPRRSQKDSGAEKHTHADGVVGQFVIGGTGRGDLVLDEHVKHFVVTEAKMASPLSQRTTHAPTYDQAARTVACMAHAVAVANRSVADVTLGFYVVAPASRIERGVFDVALAKDGIGKKVRERAVMHDEASHKEWLERWFTPVLNRMDIAAISWESVIRTIREIDQESGQQFDEFYSKCLEYN